VTDRPTRATVAGRAYLDLQNLARRTKRPTDELHQIYALEGFLARLVESAYADHLILKAACYSPLSTCAGLPAMSTFRDAMSPTTSTRYLRS